MRLFIVISLYLLPQFIFAQHLLYPKEENKKWGYVDQISNQTIIPFIYDKAWSFNKEGYGLVTKNGKMGLIDETGKEILPIKFQFIGNSTKEKYTRNKTLKINNRIFVKANNHWGMLDKNFKQKIAIKYENIKDFTLKTDLDPKLEESPTNYKWLTFYKVKLNGKWGIMNEKEEFILDPKYDDVKKIGIFKERISKDSYISTTTFRPYSGKSFLNIFLVKNGDSSKIIYTDGSVIFKDKNLKDAKLYSFIGRSKENIFILKKQDNYGGVSMSGKVIIPFEHEAIKPHQGSFFIRIHQFSRDSYPSHSF